jgi:hypothetical protein
MKRRMFLMAPAALAARAAVGEPERVEVENFTWRESADKAPNPGATVRVQFKGQPHDVTVTRVDAADQHVAVAAPVEPRQGGRARRRDLPLGNLRQPGQSCVYRTIGA